jgi:amino acid adenylation domain-containing protein/non-ribosomal peptide synthase protein (TIGR01720 family)
MKDCPIVVILDCSRLPLQLLVEYSTSTLSRKYARAIVNSLAHILQCLVTISTTTIAKLDLLGPQNVNTVASWNNLGSQLPSEHCIHTLIRQQCMQQPSAEAIHGPEGKITYGELDMLSERVKLRLQNLGVGAESTVILCFQKSIWTAVAMLGVLKAGGAFVLLDTSYPYARLVAMCQDVDAWLILTSRMQLPQASKLADHVMVVEQETIMSNNDPVEQNSEGRPVTSKSTAYIAYTSGSTGRPKGIVIEHGSFCTNALASSRAQNLNRGSRVLQFASYGFDISIHELLTTLIVGGCVCIPSEEQRLNNLTTAIAELRVNWVELTPSVARLLPADQVPFDTLVLGGESMTCSDIETWSGKVQLISAYGPAECTVVTTIQPDIQIEDPRNIGRSWSGTCWIVDPDNYHKLLPIGAIGELLIGGHIVGRGYINHPSSDMFVVAPAWAADFRLRKDERFYRSGDLVQYAADGTLRYIGRKDTQVKLHGQRIDLQEVEYQAGIFAQGLAVAAEVATLPDSESSIALVLFIADALTVSQDVSLPATVCPLTEPRRDFLSAIRAWLSEKLPFFMVPSIYISLSHIPLSPSGKADRKALKTIAATNGVLRTYQSASMLSKAHLKVATKREYMFQRLFSEILGLHTDSIRPGDGFFHLGGTSIAAIKLVARARDEGYNITVIDVFTHQTLSGISLVASEIEFQPVQVIAPLSLVSDPFDILRLATKQCKTTAESIEDVLPCTPMQEAVIALSLKASKSLTGRYMFELQQPVNLARFRKAWEQVERSHSILRTRVIQDDRGRLQQVVLRESASWIVESSLEKVESELDKQCALMGTPLARVALVDQLTPFFILHMHHAAFDGWSYLQIIEDLENAFNGQALDPRPSFSSIVKYSLHLDRDQAKLFWASEFDGLQADPFPPPPPDWIAPKSPVTLTRKVALPTAPSGGHTLSNMVQLAWAIAVAAQTGSSEVVVGRVVTGRNAPVPGIERIGGPTIATLPLRIKLPPGTTTEEILHNIQEQLTAMIPFEQTGMQHIRTATPEAARACEFQNLLVIQPRPMESNSSLLRGLPQNQEQMLNFTTHVLTLVVELGEDSVAVTALFDDSVLSAHDMKLILTQFESALQQVIHRPGGTPVGHIQLCSESDRDQISRWNTEALCEGEIRCAHDLIARQCMSQPQAEAICSWDGSLTYRELLERASALAGRLKSSNIGPEMVVPICTERSKWQPVAMLAVLLTGAAFVLMEPTFPIARLRSMCRQVEAPLILSSPRQLEACNSLADEVILLIEESFVPQDMRYQTDLHLASPDNTMYVAFTSGSTGTPKGITIEHGMFYTSFSNCREHYSLCNTSRTLFFSSPAFDSSIMEVVSTLAAGGCVCVPSEEQRTHDLSTAIVELGVNLLILTPSVARLLSPAELPNVKTVMLVGELMSASDINRWVDAVQLVCGYGPAECTILTTMTRNIQPDSPCNIGLPVGSSCWVVNPHNHNQLLPIGAVGELMIGGRIVGRGYVNQPAETSAAFIHNPAWMSSTLPAKTERFYKSGDLVHYEEDGTLEYHGRKDTQVKIHGQRIELGEVESQARKLLPGAEVVADVLKTNNGASSTLVNFVLIGNHQQGALPPVAQEAPGGVAPQLFIPGTPEFVSVTEAVKSRMREVLPPFMVPSVFIRLGYLPLSHSGKINRKLLRQEWSKLDQNHIEPSGKMPSWKRTPSTETQKVVCEIFATVLSLDPPMISIDDSFFDLGGDSISAMRALSLLRKSGFHISMADFFVNSTVSLLLQTATIPVVDTPPYEAIAESGDDFLSPIQRMFFNTVSPDHRFNQSFFLEVRKAHSPEEWYRALEQVVQQHPMLRARFTCGEGQQPTVRIAPDIEGCLRVEHHDVQKREDIIVIAGGSQSRIDIEQGPLISLDIINLNGEATFAFIVAHHLVVDLVSWRIILDDIENLLGAAQQLESHLYSFQRWVHVQTLHFKEPVEPSSVLPFDICPAPLSYWGVDPEQNTFGISISHHFILDQSTTAALLGPANAPYASHPQEIFLAALLHSFSIVFTDRTTPSIYIESHGREALFAGIDLSRTVGWFTTMWPLAIADCHELSLTELVRRVKDRCRSVPENGLPYFGSRYLNSACSDAFREHEKMEVLFNYAGRFQQLERKDSLFRQPSWAPDMRMDVDPDTRRFALFDVSVELKHGCLYIDVLYPETALHQEEIRLWTVEYELSLNRAAEALATLSRQPTLADFPCMTMSYTDLEILEGRIKSHLGVDDFDMVESVYPCSDAHSGLIRGQTGSAGAHRARIIFHIKSSKKIDALRASDVWRQLIRRHSILRSVVVETPLREDPFVLLVLKDVDLAIPIHHCVDKDEALKVLSLLPQQRLPPASHHICDFALCTTSDGYLLLRVETGQAVLDSVSLSILLQEFIVGMEGQLPCSVGPSYSKYLLYLQSLPQKETATYWKNAMASLQPCLLAPMNMEARNQEHQCQTVEQIIAETGTLKKFCALEAFTLTNIFQVAWGMVLQRYTESERVCFGTLLSGREVPVPDALQTVGPFFNVLPCCLEFGSEIPLLNILRQNQQEMQNRLQHQHCSLLDILPEMPMISVSRPFFNTCITVQSSFSDKEQEKTGNWSSNISFELLENNDPSEVRNIFYSCRTYRRKSLFNPLSSTISVLQLLFRRRVLRFRYGIGIHSVQEVRLLRWLMTLSLL